MGERILIDLERLRYAHSGLGYFCKCLSKGLEEINTTKSELYFYTHLQNYQHRIRYNPLHKIFNFSTRQFEVLHITHQNQSCFRRTYHVPHIIVTLHDLNFLYEDISENKRQRLIASAKSNLQKADFIVCISDYVKQDLLKYQHFFNLKPTVKIEVIHNGIILENFHQTQDETPRFDALKGKKFLLSIGVLAHKKQQHLLLQALTYLPQNIHLVLVYSMKKSEYFKFLLSIIEKEHLKDRVFFFENITNNQKSYLINHALGLVHPSIAEGFGIPPIESMVAGKPVFLSRATSIPEICGNEAYYFNNNRPEDMSKVILEGLNAYNNDNGKSERLKHWSQRYDYRRMAQQYLNLYRRCLKED